MYFSHLETKKNLVITGNIFPSAIPLFYILLLENSSSEEDGTFSITENGKE